MLSLVQSSDNRRSFFIGDLIRLCSNWISLGDNLEWTVWAVTSCCKNLLLFLRDNWQPRYVYLVFTFIIEKHTHTHIFYDSLLLYTREQHVSENGASSWMKADLELQHERFISTEVCKSKLQLLPIVPMSKGKAFFFFKSLSLSGVSIGLKFVKTLRVITGSASLTTLFRRCQNRRNYYKSMHLLIISAASRRSLVSLRWGESLHFVFLMVYGIERPISPTLMAVFGLSTKTDRQLGFFFACVIFLICTYVPPVLFLPLRKCRTRIQSVVAAICDSLPSGHFGGELLIRHDVSLRRTPRGFYSFDKITEHRDPLSLSSSSSYPSLLETGSGEVKHRAYM